MWVRVLDQDVNDVNRRCEMTCAECGKEAEDGALCDHCAANWCDRCSRVADGVCYVCGACRYCCDCEEEEDENAEDEDDDLLV